MNIMISAMKSIQTLTSKQSQINKSSTFETSFECNDGLMTVSSPYFNALQNIFPQISLHQIIKDFKEYLSLPSEILGKRSSKIVISKSRKYCLKFIEQEDLTKLLQMFQKLIEKFKQPNNNCLVSIYFLFAVQYFISGVKLTDRFIIMPNIRTNFDHCIKAFDIKGHLEDRVIAEEDFQDFKFGKDQNFIQSQQLKNLKKLLPQEKLQQIHSNINQSIKFLDNQHVLDYSLLISIQKKLSNNQKYPCQNLFINEDTVIKWVIIDYFQIFNDKKKIENRFKSFFKKSISSVQPQIYSKRLICFIQKYLLN